MSYKFPHRQGIPLKKQYGQHFLKDGSIVDNMVHAVHLDSSISVMEIGCGEGILTQAILQSSCKQLTVFEIDQEWADFVTKLYGSDKRLRMMHENVLDVRFDLLEKDKPWVLLANLPYQITFPIFHRLQQYRHLFTEGVVMIQEEVAQKLVKTSGRDYGYSSLFFQYFFELKLLDKIAPESFYPPPKVFSRLLYFKPKTDLVKIPNEEDFWKFIKLCFHQPRRTLRNNLAQSHFDLSKLSSDLLLNRAQQLTMQDLIAIWDILIR